MLDLLGQSGLLSYASWLGFPGLDLQGGGGLLGGVFWVGSARWSLPGCVVLG